MFNDEISQSQKLNQINDGQNQIIKQDIEKEPLISSAVKISMLFEEFNNVDNFLKKVICLEKTFEKTIIRKARKDGNSFYRSFIFRLCEILCLGNQFFEKFKIFQKVKQFSAMMIKAGFAKIVFEEFENFFLEFLNAIRSGSINILNVQNSLSDKCTFDYYVMYLRFIISAYIRTCGGLFDTHFKNDNDVKQFCVGDVETVDVEADQIQIISLFNLFEIPTRIYYLDNKPNEVPIVLSLPELEKNGVSEIKKSQSIYLIQLMYRPDHYDILY